MNHTRQQPDRFAPDGIHDLASAFQCSRVLLTAYELGLLAALGNQRRTRRHAVAREELVGHGWR